MKVQRKEYDFDFPTSKLKFLITFLSLIKSVIILITNWYFYHCSKKTLLLTLHKISCHAFTLSQLFQIRQVIPATQSQHSYSK